LEAPKQSDFLNIGGQTADGLGQDVILAYVALAILGAYQELYRHHSRVPAIHQLFAQTYPLKIPSRVWRDGSRKRARGRHDAPLEQTSGPFLLGSTKIFNVAG